MAVDSDLGEDQPHASKRSRVSGSEVSARLRGRGTIKYSEETSESDEPGPSDQSLSQPQQHPTTPPRTQARPKGRRTQIRTRNQTSSQSAKSGRHQRTTPAKPSRASKPSQRGHVIPSDGKIPNWSALPYHVLLSVFQLAYNTFRHDERGSQTSINWILRAARTCRAFAEPALTAFYRAPSIPSNAHAHLFMDLISKPKEELTFDYSMKVRQLDIDIAVLAYSVPGRGRPDIAQLIARLPKLKSIQLYNEIDERPIYLPLLNSHPNWEYPPNLFDSLQQNNIRLDGWRWHSHLAPSYLNTSNASWLQDIHSSPPFKSLERLEMSQFTLEYPGLSESLAPLENLRTVELVFCGFAAEDFEPEVPFFLPPTVENLHLSFSIVPLLRMLDILSTSGPRLKELHIVDTKFNPLPLLYQLNELCPKLEVLHLDSPTIMDAQNIDTTQAWSSEDLISRPATWPGTLREIHILNHRFNNPTVAEGFFQSLLDAAPHLPSLRILVLKAAVDIAWRQRAVFRDRWTARLERVFLRRHSKPPSPHLASFAAFRAWKAQQEQAAESSRKKTAAATAHVREGGAATQDSPARGLRSRDPPPQREHAEGDTDVEEVFIHGMCDAVTIRLDNLRPARDQYTEADFLDDEPPVSEDSDFVD
jgi:hypothetical protein